MRKGTVYLVGAGPGDPGLITRRGLELLRSADVVLYDRLVAPELVAEARPDAEVIFVGKRPGEVHSRQLVADALLISKAKEGRSVVRLKGGDPFVFGRGSEEAALLGDSGVPFEIVPGVSSAIAVPAYAGIPVTARGVSSSFLVLTGREEDAEEPSHDWPAIAAAADTLVLLMGVAALEGVAQRLIAGGRDPEEPAAVIEWGTTGRQRSVTAPLAAIAATAADAELKAPAITVVGHVVDSREAISWFEARPLFGRSVVVTRARTGALSEGLVELGAEVVPLPVIATAPPSDLGPLERAVKDLPAYDWVILSSATAVRALFDALDRAGLDARSLLGTKMAAVGAVTAKSLRDHGIRADLVPRESTAAALVETLPSGRGKVLWPRAEVAPQEPVAALREVGWTVDEVPAYRTVPGEPQAMVLERVRTGEFDAVTFTSASTVTNFAALVGSGIPEGYSVVCIGPETAAAARAAGFTVDAIAEPHNTEGLVAAVHSVLATPR